MAEPPPIPIPVPTPEPPPPSVVLSADEAFEYDLKLLAEAYPDVPIDRIRASLINQNSVGAAAAVVGTDEISWGERERFGESAVITLKGEGSPQAWATLQAAGAQVQGGGRFSMDELDLRVRVVANALDNLGYELFSVSPVDGDGRIAVELPVGTFDDQKLADQLAVRAREMVDTVLGEYNAEIADARAAATRLADPAIELPAAIESAPQRALGGEARQILATEIQTLEVDPTSLGVAETSVRGGELIDLPGTNQCTSGFAVAIGPVHGYVTANHCVVDASGAPEPFADVVLVDSLTNLTHPTQAPDGFVHRPTRDLALVRTGVHHVGEFYIDVGTKVEQGQIVLLTHGDHVCVFGRKSLQRYCERTVTDFLQCKTNNYGGLARGLTKVSVDSGNSICHGDSGAPYEKQGRIAGVLISAGPAAASDCAYDFELFQPWDSMRVEQGWEALGPKITSPVPPGAGAPVRLSCGTNTVQFSHYAQGGGVVQGQTNDQWQVRAGSTPLGSEYFLQNTTGTSVVLTGLPTNGSPVYVSLWHSGPNQWNMLHKATYYACGSTITTPVSNSRLTCGTITVATTGGSAEGTWQLYAGPTPESMNYFSTSSANAASFTVTGLPTGPTQRLVYLSLYHTTPHQGMVLVDVVPYYTCNSGKITAPATTLYRLGGTGIYACITPTISFSGASVGTWRVTASTIAQSSSQSYLTVNSTNGTSVSLAPLPWDGEPVVARLWYQQQVGGSWLPMDTRTWDYQVCRGHVDTPAASTTLACVPTIGIYGSGLGSWQVRAGSSPGASDFFAGNVGGNSQNGGSIQLSGLPNNSWTGVPTTDPAYHRPTVYVSLWHQMPGSTQWRKIGSDRPYYPCSARLTNPPQLSTTFGVCGSTLVTFPGGTVGQWRVQAGTTSTNSTYFSGIATNGTSIQVTGLPSGTTLSYISLWHKAPGKTVFTRYSWAGVRCV